MGITAGPPARAIGAGGDKSNRRTRELLKALPEVSVASPHFCGISTPFGTLVAFPPPGRRPLGGRFMHPSSTPPADPTPVPADPPDGPNAEAPVTAGEEGRRRKVTFAKDAAGFLTELR